LDLVTTLPLNERYTYDFEGNSEVLDHILLSPGLSGRPFSYDPVHVNAEFPNHASDHDPQVVLLTLAQAPAITSAASTTFTAGSAGTFTATSTGIPTPVLSETGALPSSVTFADNGDGTATLAGTPAAGTGGSYALTFTATNSVDTATQQF